MFDATILPTFFCNQFFFLFLYIKYNLLNLINITCLIIFLSLKFYIFNILIYITENIYKRAPTQDFMDL